MDRSNNMIPAQAFQQQVLAWFDRHGRHDLPWQDERSAYRVWLSEIMLQQTQVKTVIPYFQRFVRRYADVVSLAAAKEDEVLHLWTGLGYYARARNLLKCARVIRDQHGGQFPGSVEELEALPGIGRSTAGAIVSQAFQRRAAVLDGNVKRVLARYAAIEGWPGQAAVHQQLWDLAESLTPQDRCRDYTQAMMDLGATRCTRSKPDCESCPLNASCLAYRQGDQNRYPGKKPRKVLPVKSTIMLILRNPTGEVYLARRPTKGIWGGLWSFPEVGTLEEGVALCLDCFGREPHAINQWPTLRHTFSHYHLDIDPVQLQITSDNQGVAEAEGGRWIDPLQPQAIGMAAPVVKLLAKLDHAVNNQS